VGAGGCCQRSQHCFVPARLTPGFVDPLSPVLDLADLQPFIGFTFPTVRAEGGLAWLGLVTNHTILHFTGD
jgi:hypothetical protein